MRFTWWSRIHQMRDVFMGISGFVSFAFGRVTANIDVPSIHCPCKSDGQFFYPTTHKQINPHFSGEQCLSISMADHGCFIFFKFCCSCQSPCLLCTRLEAVSLAVFREISCSATMSQGGSTPYSLYKIPS